MDMHAKYGQMANKDSTLIKIKTTTTQKAVFYTEHQVFHIFAAEDERFYSTN